MGCGESPFINDEKNPGDLVVARPSAESKLTLTKKNLIVHPFFRVGPSVGDENNLLIIITDKSSKAIDHSLDLRVMLWMPTMGHGSFPVTVTETSSGVFEASEIFFTMPGYWDVHFQIYENNNLIEEVKWGFTL